MKNAKIKFVRMYKNYGYNIFEVIYKSGRVTTHIGEERLPKTALDYVMAANNRNEYHSTLFNRDEMIYEIAE
jgi:hypothetical protein